MDYIYGKLNVEKILKEYTADNLAEGTADISIDNTKNKISAKVNRTPGKLVITKSINGNEKKELVSFDGSVDKEINLDEVDAYTGVETETSKPTIDTENNTIKVDVKKTPGKIRFEKANKLIKDDLGNPIEFDGSKDITLDIPETLFEEMDSDTFEFIKVDNITNKIQASVLKVPHKLTINNPDGSVDVFDGSNNVSISMPNLSTYINKDNILGNLPKFTNKIILSVSNTSTAYSFPIVNSSNFYVDWGDGTANFYENATTSLTHTFNSTGNLSVTIYGDWKGIKYSSAATPSKNLIREVYYDSNIIEIPSYAFYQCGFLFKIDFASRVSIGSYAFYGCDFLKYFPFEKCDSLRNSSYSFAYSSLLFNNEIGLYNAVSDSTGLFSHCCMRNVTFIDDENANSTGSGGVVISPNHFSYCTYLESVTIHGNLWRIYSNAFKGCANLKRVYITHLNRNSIIELENSNAFSDTHADLIIFVPHEFLEDYKTAPGWSDICDKIYPAGGSYSEMITITPSEWSGVNSVFKENIIGVTSEQRNIITWTVVDENGIAVDTLPYGIKATSQGTMALTFNCTEKPTEDIRIHIISQLTNY